LIKKRNRLRIPNDTTNRAVLPDGNGYGQIEPDSLLRPARRLKQFRRVIRPAGAKEYRVTKTEIRRNVFGISLTNSETWQAQHG
jgi:hypothetical protein